MNTKQQQIARLIHTHIAQLNAALHDERWCDIQTINQQVNRLLRAVMPSTDHQRALSKELHALQQCLTRVQNQGQQREKMLADKLEAFRDQQEGLRAYQEAQGWA